MCIICYLHRKTKSKNINHVLLQFKMRMRKYAKETCLYICFNGYVCLDFEITLLTELYNNDEIQSKCSIILVKC